MEDFEKYTETRSFITRIQGRINGVFEWSSSSPKFEDYAPAELQEKVNEFLTYLSQYDSEKLRPQPKLHQEKCLIQPN